MTEKQEARQTLRNRAGRYKTNPCYGCGKGAPILTYGSHPMTDTKGPDGENWADVALVLCDRCGKETAEMKNVSEFVAYQKAARAKFVFGKRIMAGR